MASRSGTESSREALTILQRSSAVLARFLVLGLLPSTLGFGPGLKLALPGRG